MKKINLLVRDKGLNKLILQFITGEDIEIVQLGSLEGYESGILLLGFENISFWNVLKIINMGIKNIIIVKSESSTFKWYNFLIMYRYKAIITPPFGRKDFQKALTYVFSIERRK